MAQSMKEFNVTKSTWTEVANGDVNVAIASNEIQPFLVHLSGDQPMGDPAAHPGVRGAYGNPISFTGLDPDTKVFVRAESIPTKVIVTK